MASSISLASPFLLVILYHLLLQTDRTCFASNPTSFRLTLTRVGFGKNLPKNQYAPSSLNDSKNAERYGPQPSLKSTAQSSYDVYVTNLTIGTPPVVFSAIVDTGSDLIWTRCHSSPGLYDSSTSKSFSKINRSCGSFHISGCQQGYDGNTIDVSMGQDTLTIGGVSSTVTFACGTPKNKKSFNKYDGIVGLGRGELSLVSQLKVSVFSYCLASRYHKLEQSILLIGSEARTAMAETITTNVQTTPLLTQRDQSNYYISLEGISVGETRLSLNKSDFAIKEDNTGGMIIDSGTTFTYLEEGIINMIENEFMKQTKLKTTKGDKPLYDGLTRCFELPYEMKIIPKLVFHFSGANWDLPRENYIYEKKGKACLAFIATDKKDPVSIFGNMQQQNMMVLYDLDKNNLSFKPAKCNEL